MFYSNPPRNGIHYNVLIIEDDSNDIEYWKTLISKLDIKINSYWSQNESEAEELISDLSEHGIEFDLLISKSQFLSINQFSMLNNILLVEK